MKYICTRACIGKFHGASSLDKTKQTFQIHARDKVRFKNKLGQVMWGVIYRNGKSWEFTVSVKTVRKNFIKIS